jgi:hypothetical protein
MASAGASFSVEALGAGAGDRPDLDAALAIYIKNTSPLLRTLTQQIRQTRVCVSAGLTCGNRA